MVDVLVIAPIGRYLPLISGALIRLMMVTNIKSSIKVYCGCSLGSLLSLMLTLGYTPKEILLDLIDNKDIHLGDMVNITNIKSKIQQLLIDKLGTIPTLQQLYYATGLSLVTTTFNLSYGRTEFLSYETTPDLSTDEAVIMSMNIPLLFYNIEYQGCNYIDGSIGNPYPVNYFDNGSNRVLGISYQSVEDYTVNPLGPSSNVTRYIYRIIEVLSSQIQTNIRKSTSSKCYHLTLDVENKYSIEDMILSGYNQADTFINNIVIS
jgi:predicted acylesterase/phospholipase RssA